MFDYIKKASGADSAQVEAQFGNAKLEISEGSMQQIDYAKSTIQKSFYRRTMSLGFQNRVTVLEIETAD